MIECKPENCFMCGEEDRLCHKAYLEGVKSGRRDTIEDFAKTKAEVLNWLVKRISEGYGTTNGELLDYIYEIAEQMKGNRQC